MPVRMLTGTGGVVPQAESRPGEAPGQAICPPRSWLARWSLREGHTGPHAQQHCWCPLPTSSTPAWDRPPHSGSRPEGAAPRWAPGSLAGHAPPRRPSPRGPRHTYRRRVDAQLPRQEEERLPQHVHIHLPGEAHAGAVGAARRRPAPSSSPSWLERPGRGWLPCPRQALPWDPCLPGGSLASASLACGPLGQGPRGHQKRHPGKIKASVCAASILGC